MGNKPAVFPYMLQGTDFKFHQYNSDFCLYAVLLIWIFFHQTFEDSSYDLVVWNRVGNHKLFAWFFRHLYENWNSQMTR